MKTAIRRLPRAEARKDTTGQVQSLTRALSLLRALAESGDGMTLTDVAQMVGLPPSTAHRLLTTLQQERFVRFDGTAHLWQVGVEAFIIGNAFVRTRDVVAMARPYLRRLMEEGGETANLYLEQDGEAICMAQVECRQMMRAIARPGGRVKMHCSGAGKAMLGWLPDGELTRIIRSTGCARVTERTLDTPTPAARGARAGARARLRGRRRGARGGPALRRRAGVRRARPAGGGAVAVRAGRAGRPRRAWRRLGELTAQIAGELSAELGGHSAARRFPFARYRRQLSEFKSCPAVIPRYGMISKIVCRACCRPG